MAAFEDAFLILRVTMLSHSHLIHLKETNFSGAGQKMSSVTTSVSLLMNWKAQMARRSGSPGPAPTKERSLYES
jgi:hypothetical protein